jgi:iron complex transport system permease protein
LISPHICRRIVGADHRKLMVAAPLVGAAFLMVADSAVRVAVVFNHGQMPVGVVTALCGGPLFLILLRRRG